jgi:hypothetical protein
MQCATTPRVISPAPPIRYSLASAHSRLAVCSSPQQSCRRGHDEGRCDEGAACARSLMGCIFLYSKCPAIFLSPFSSVSALGSLSLTFSMYCLAASTHNAWRTAPPTFGPEFMALHSSSRCANTTPGFLRCYTSPLGAVSLSC